MFSNHVKTSNAVYNQYLLRAHLYIKFALDITDIFSQVLTFAQWYDKHLYVGEEV